MKLAKIDHLPAESLQLIDGGGTFSRLEPASPVGDYICTLNSDEGQRTSLTCLRRVARLLGATSTEEVNWEAMRYSHVEKFKDQLRKKGYQPSSINATLAALKGVARSAWRLDLMPDKDYLKIKDVRGVPAKRDRAGRALSFEELSALLDACARDPSPAGARDACLVALMAGGGLRRSEAVAAHLDHWCARDHALHVHGKGNRERRVYFDEGGARLYILAWLRVRGAGEGALLRPVTQRGAVLPRAISAQAAYHALIKRARQAGLRRSFSPHDLRRTWATEMLDGGADINLVKQLLGHASIDTTAIYDRRPEAAKREAARSFKLPFRVRRKRGPHKGHRRRKFRKGEFRP